MSNWGILDDNSLNTDGDVEYVGMADDDVPPVRVPRRPVRRASQASIPAYSQASIPAYNRPAPRHPMQPEKGGMYHLPTLSGSSVAMNDEAIQNMRSGGVHDIGGRTALRVQPGTYVTYGPGRGPSGLSGVGMGGGMGDINFDVGEFVASIGGAVAAIGGMGIEARRSQREMELAREAQRIESEAAEAAREIAMLESMQSHEERMADIERAYAELEELRRARAQIQQEQDQYATTTPLPANGGGGTSPVVWILLAVVGIGGVGTLVWFLTRDKGKDKDRYRENW